MGGPVTGDVSSPELWIAALRQRGYRAAYCPLTPDADDTMLRAYRDAAAEAGIVIAEVGAWCNPISPDEATRRTAMETCKRGLELAERIGARCCVNISGSRGKIWDGPDPQNLMPETFELIVATVCEILDAVQPRHTFYTLETMPWAYPNSVESYLQLIQAIDRPQFGVHLDPVNLVCSPQHYFDNAALLRHCFSTLGPHIRSCHAKDIALAPRLTVHLDEVRPGLGHLDYAVYLRELANLEGEVPLMLEHLPDAQEYLLAAAYLRSIATEVGLTF